MSCCSIITICTFKGFRQYITAIDTILLPNCVFRTSCRLYHSPPLVPMSLGSIVPIRTFKRFFQLFAAFHTFFCPHSIFCAGVGRNNTPPVIGVSCRKMTFFHTFKCFRSNLTAIDTLPIPELIFSTGRRRYQLAPVIFVFDLDDLTVLRLIIGIAEFWHRIGFTAGVIDGITIDHCITIQDRVILFSDILVPSKLVGHHARREIIRQNILHSRIRISRFLRQIIATLECRCSTASIYHVS